MHYQILTIFPEMFSGLTQFGLLSRAVRGGIISLSVQQLRDYAINTHGQIDDTPFGGGSGMVLRCEPAVAAIEGAKERDPGAKVVLFSPRGKTLNHQLAQKLSQDAQKADGGFILLCCRYEGVDERIAQEFVDYEINIGDFILMGGEVAAMAFIEATCRFIPGVLGNPDSLREESFSTGLLEYPQYTKPQDFRGHKVPSVLLSGNHAEIDRWRDERAYLDTLERRPDLFEKSHARKPTTLGQVEVNVALIHYPVLDKTAKTVTSSITNLDLHDIARSAKTFGLDHYYIAHPTKVLRKLMNKVCEHWSEGYGLSYNPNRSEALALVKIVSSFDDVIIDIEARTGVLPYVVATSARASQETVTFTALKQKIAISDRPFLILLGTGWGLGDEVLDRCDLQLEPIVGAGEYNHLSVRAAAAIIFEKLFGRC